MLTQLSKLNPKSSLLTILPLNLQLYMIQVKQAIEEIISELFKNENNPYYKQLDKICLDKFISLVFTIPLSLK